jgi:putative endonuclease
MKKNRNLGQEGERLAVNLLKDNQYEILATNWRYGKKEIDIIAKKDRQLIIVEVKLRSDPEFEDPREAITKTKQKTIIQAANAFIEQNNITFETRFDVIAIDFSNYEPVIEHMEDAFYPMVR